MSDYLAVCGQCASLTPHLYCPVQGHKRKKDRVICVHFTAAQPATKDTK